MESEHKKKVIIYIATPLELEEVKRIRAVNPKRIEVIYDPDLLPPTRYIADHNGVKNFVLDPSKEKRWKNNIARAEILWDFPPVASNGVEGITFAKNLKWIQATSSGIGQRVKYLGLENSDILITTARGVHAGPLTEFVFLCLLSYVRRLPHLQAEQKKHRWERFCGYDLEGKTLSIIGIGAVGRKIASIGRSFGMQVVALSSKQNTQSAKELGVDFLYPEEKLHQMLSATDALVLSVPHTITTKNLINEQAFDTLKQGALFVNIARGQVIDENALIRSLQSRRIAFAGLDVFTVEPLPQDSPLWDMPNVLISPHSSSTSTSENRKIADIFCHNLRCYLDDKNEEMQNLFDKTRMY